MPNRASVIASAETQGLAAHLEMTEARSPSAAIVRRVAG